MIHFTIFVCLIFITIVFLLIQCDSFLKRTVSESKNDREYFRKKLDDSGKGGFNSDPSRFTSPSCSSAAADYYMANCGGQTLYVGGCFEHRHAGLLFYEK